MTPIREQKSTRTSSGGQWWLIAIVPVALVVLATCVAALIVWVTRG